MKAARLQRSKATRFFLCLLLLLWIFHSIFLSEAKGLYPGQPSSWNGLPRLEQWRAAWTIGPQELWATLSMIPPFPLLCSVFLVGLILLVGVLRWRVALKVQGLDLPFWRTVEISLIAHFFNSFLLGTTGGDLLKAYYAARETHHKKTEAVITVFVDRLIGFLSMLLFTAFFMLPNGYLMSENGRLKALALVILMMLCAAAMAAFMAFWGGFSRWWPGARVVWNRLPKGEWIERSLRSCRSFGGKPGALAGIFGLSMILNALSVLQVLTLSRGLSLSIPILTGLLVVPMIICISSLPITPSGLGVRENLFVVILAAPPFAIPGKVAISLSLLAYAGNLLWSLVGGIVYLCVKEKEHLPEIVSDPTDAASPLAP